jgi:acyl carrier protein
MADAEKTVVKALKGVLKRRNKANGSDVVVGDIDVNADLYEDLELDSLDVAELSAVLEDDLGHDPYSDGQLPRTVAEVIDYYNE